MKDTRLSLKNVFELRARAFAKISDCAFVVDAIAAALADLDTAMMVVIAERTVDDEQALITSARNLAKLLDGGQA